jgi:hypothetical protein
VGTSRAALSVAKAAVQLAGEEEPDAIVITSGLLMHVDNTQPSAERNVGRLERITQPTFLVDHSKDRCRYSTWGNSGISSHQGGGNQLSRNRQAHLMGPCNHGGPQWTTMSDWTCR